MRAILSLTRSGLHPDRGVPRSPSRHAIKYPPSLLTSIIWYTKPQKARSHGHIWKVTLLYHRHFHNSLPYSILRSKPSLLCTIESSLPWLHFSFEFNFNPSIFAVQHAAASLSHIRSSACCACAQLSKEGGTRFCASIYYSLPLIYEGSHCIDPSFYFLDAPSVLQSSTSHYDNPSITFPDPTRQCKYPEENVNLREALLREQTTAALCYL